jgi:hypothetical protein
MALFLRPQLSFAAPPTTFVGETTGITVIVECSEPIVVTAIEVVLCGFHRVGRDTFPTSDPFWRASANIEIGARLDAGRHERQVTFRLPEGAPSSYRGEAFDIAYRLDARARVTGWVDARASAWLAVIGRPAGALDDRIAFATREDGPKGRRPYFEAALARRLIEPGTSVEAVVSLANVAENRCRELRARLIAVESATHPLTGLVERHRELDRWTVKPLGDAFAEDAPVRFQLQMPRMVVPGFVAPRVSLRWFLEIRADVELGADPRVWIPIDFGRGDSAGGHRESSPAPVGIERIALLWRSFAERSGMGFDGQRLSGDVAGWRLEVGRTDLPSKGLGLWLELRGSAGIGLRFDRTWSARDREHARLLAAVPRPAIGKPSAVDDTAIWWSIEEPGLSHEGLASVVRDACLTAAALREAIDALDVPSVLRPWAEPLQRLAARYDGELHRPSCTVHGRRDELSIRVAPMWEGSDDEVAFCVELDLPLPMSRDVQTRWRSALDGGLLGEIAGRVRAVTAEGCTIRCVMAATWDPALVVEDVEQLFTLARATTTGSGPYR